MKIAKALVALAGAAVLTFSVAACSSETPQEKPEASQSESAPEGSEEAPAGEPLHIGLIMLQGDTYFQGIQSGLEEAVKADGGKVTVGLSNNDPATENEVARNMIQAKVDAVLIQPTADEASLPSIKAIKDAGIPVICYGNCVGVTADEANVDGVIQSDNTALGTGTGAVAAEYAKANLNSEVNLAILNCDVASACKLRKAGFLEELDKAGIKVNVVTDQEAFLVDKATPVAANILAANPDVNMVWASNDGGTAGGVIGVKQAANPVPVFGTDISTQIAEFILADDDVLQATTGQDPVGTAKGAYEMAKTVIDGGTVSPHSVELPGITYDRANPATTNEFLGK